MSRKSASAFQAGSLYKGEGEIAMLVLGDDAKRWPELAVMFEREGMPQIDPLTGKRFYPAVEQFFANRHGVRAGRVPATADGVEAW